MLLTTIRDKLKNDTNLSNFFATRYPGNAPRYFIGYKRPVNANDYPAVCIVPVTGTRPAAIGHQSQQIISIVVALNEPGLVDDVFDGVTYTQQAADLVLSCLAENGGVLTPTAYHIGDPRVTTDLGIRHPFYEIEITATFAALLM